MDVIHKGSGDLKVTPNLTDYEQTSASFDWSEVPDVCAGSRRPAPRRIR